MGRRHKALSPDNRSEWYGLIQWKRRSANQLREQPLCQMCLQRGVLSPATVADHVQAHGGNLNAFLLGELQSLCARCHSSYKQRVDRGFRERPIIGEDGWPIDTSTSAPPRSFGLVSGNGVT
jgi:hypothetical protein